MELPYTLVQDSTLFLLLRETTDAVWREKLNWIRQHHGTALLNLHPDYVCFTGSELEMGEFPVELYAGFLKWVKETHGASHWHALPCDLAEHCRQQIFDADPGLASAQFAALPARAKPSAIAG